MKILQIPILIAVFLCLSLTPLSYALANEGPSHGEILERAQKPEILKGTEYYSSVDGYTMKCGCSRECRDNKYRLLNQLNVVLRGKQVGTCPDCECYDKDIVLNKAETECNRTSDNPATYFNITQYCIYKEEILIDQIETDEGKKEYLSKRREELEQECQEKRVVTSCLTLRELAEELPKNERLRYFLLSMEVRRDGLKKMCGDQTMKERGLYCHDAAFFLAATTIPEKNYYHSFNSEIPIRHKEYKEEYGTLPARTIEQQKEITEYMSFACKYAVSEYRKSAFCSDYDTERKILLMYDPNAKAYY